MSRKMSGRQLRERARAVYTSPAPVRRDESRENSDKKRKYCINPEGCGKIQGRFSNGLCKRCFRDAYRGSYVHKVSRQYIMRKKKCLIAMSASVVRSNRMRQSEVEKQIAQCKDRSIDSNGNTRERPTAHRQYIIKNHEDVTKLIGNRDLYSETPPENALRHCGFYVQDTYRREQYRGRMPSPLQLRDRKYEVKRVGCRSEKRASEVKGMQRLTHIPYLDSLVHLTSKSVWYARLSPGMWRCRVISGDPCYAKPQKIEVVLNGFSLLNLKTSEGMCQGRYAVGEATFSFHDGIARLEGIVTDKREAARVCTIEFFPIRFFRRNLTGALATPLRVSFGPRAHKVPDGFVVETGSPSLPNVSVAKSLRPRYGWPYNDSVSLSSRARKNDRRARNILRRVNERTLSGARLLLTAGAFYFTRFEEDDCKGPLTARKRNLGDVYGCGILAFILKKYVGPNLCPVSDRRRLRYSPSLWVFCDDRVRGTYEDIGCGSQRRIELRVAHAVPPTSLSAMKASRAQYTAELARELLSHEEGRAAYRVWLAYRNVPGFCPHSVFWQTVASDVGDVHDEVRNDIRTRVRIQHDMLPVTTATVHEEVDTDRFEMFDALDHALDVAKRELLHETGNLDLDDTIRWYNGSKVQKESEKRNGSLDEAKSGDARRRVRPRRNEYVPAFSFRMPIKFRAKCSWDAEKFEKQTLGAGGIFEAVFAVEEKPGWLRVLGARRTKSDSTVQFRAPRFVPLQNRKTSKRLLVRSSVISSKKIIYAKGPDKRQAPKRSLDSGLAIGFTVEAFILRFDRYDASPVPYSYHERAASRELIVAAPCPMGKVASASAQARGIHQRRFAWELAFSDDSQLEFVYWTREKKIYHQSGDSDCPGVLVEAVAHRVRSARTIPSGRWTHVAATFDGVSLRLYVDGRLEAQTRNIKVDPVNSSPIHRHFGTEEPALVVGSLPIGASRARAFRGKILLISISQEALGPKEFIAS